MLSKWHCVMCRVHVPDLPWTKSEHGVRQPCAPCVEDLRRSGFPLLARGTAAADID